MGMGIDPAVLEAVEEAAALLGQAMVSARGAIAAVEHDSARPTFHYHAPAHWMNDPNGMIFYRGWYHLFYQFNPYGDQWGHMHWGHARSRDLVNWEELPIALWPTKSKGEDHVYSGSTFIDKKGKPKIFYTSISGQRAPEQWMAITADPDLIYWSKSLENPVISEATHLPTMIDEWRDPFLFEHERHTYLLTGGIHEEKGAVVGYRAKNRELTEWEYVGIVYRHPSRRLIECPNIAKVDGHWVLLFYVDGQYIESHVGRFAADKLEFIPSSTKTLFGGSSASQLVRGKDGKWVFLAWIHTSHHKGWNGIQGLPCGLGVGADGELRTEPVKALDRLRGEKTALKNVALSGELDLSDRVTGNALEMQIEVAPGSATSLRFQLSGTAVATYDVAARTLSIPNREPITLSDGPLKLRFYLDRTQMDVFADDYRQARTASVELAPDQGLKVSAKGGTAKIVSLSAWQMKPATFDLSRYE